MSFDYDFAVIGSGFGGSVCALRLSEKGYRVAVIEAGRRFAAEDFAPTSWHVRRYLWMPAFACYGIMRITLTRHAMILSGSGVGGGSLVYANTLLIPPDAYFRDPRWAHLDDDWQMTMRPYYDTARRMLGATPAPEGSLSDDILKECAAEIGRDHTFHRPEVAVFLGEPGVTVDDPYFDGEGPPRAGCVQCGGCMVGCRFGAKNTLDKNYLYLAEKRGAQVIERTTVSDVHPLSGGGYELRMRDTGPLGSLFGKGGCSLRARSVVLSGGVMGTVKLLMECKARGSLPGLSDRLGDVVRTNSEVIVGATANDRGVDFSRGIAISAGVHVDDDTHIETVRYNKGSDLLSLLSTTPLVDGGPGMPRWMRYIGGILRHPIAFLRSLWPFGWAARTVILLVMQPVDSYLRMKLRRKLWSPLRKQLDTEWGTEKPIPTYLPQANDMARRVAGRINGYGTSSIPEALFDVPTTAHILGGCVMGRDIHEGVIDKYNRVHGYDGLWVVDGSAISANLGVNPSLSITALAEHAMSHVPQKMKIEVRGQGGE